MDETQAKKSLCCIFYRQIEGKPLLFGCGCVVKSRGQHLRIATSRKILSLEGEIFAKFHCQDAEIKLKFPTKEENSTEIAYLSTDDTECIQLPDGFSIAKIGDVNAVACRVPVFENLGKFGDQHREFSFYEVIRSQEKCSLQKQLGENKRSLDSKRELEKHHLEVLGSPILSQDNYEFMGIMDFLEVENNESFLRIVYHDGIQRNFVTGGGSSQQKTVAQETDSGLNKLTPGDSLEELWNNNIDFRDQLSKVLDVTYSEIKYWPHLAEKFGIDKITYDGFSTSYSIKSPTETMFEHLGTTQPNFKIKELCESLRESDAQEVYDIVKRSVKDKKLHEEDLVTEMCDKAPKVLETITLKLDREDRLWKSLARLRKIQHGTYSSFKTRIENPARLLFDALAAEAPALNIQDFKDKLKQLSLNNLVKILDDSEISNEEPLRDLSKYPDAKSKIERFLNNPRTDHLWSLANLYRQDDLMKDIDIEKTFRQEEDCHSPTKEMMEHVLASSPKRYTIADLIKKLKSIKREDCLGIIETYLKGGKDDIDKMTRRVENLSTVRCERPKKPSVGDENVSRAPVVASDSNVMRDEEDNQYVLSVYNPVQPVRK